MNGFVEELVKVVEVNNEVKYEIYKSEKGFIVVDYFKGEINGESIILKEYEIENYLKNSGLV